MSKVGGVPTRSFLTQNASPSERISIKSEGVGVVSRNQGESLFLICQFQALGDSVVKGNRLMQGHGCPAGMVTLVNTPTCLTGGGDKQNTGHPLAVGGARHSERRLPENTLKFV